MRRLIERVNGIEWCDVLIKGLLMLISPAAYIGASAFEYAEKCSDQELARLRALLEAHNIERQKIIDRNIKRLEGDK